MDFNKNLTKSLDANFDKNLLDLNVACGPDKLAVKVSLRKAFGIRILISSRQVDLSSKSHADITLGALAKGSISESSIPDCRQPRLKSIIVPPKLDDFALFAGLSASVDGKLTILVQATVSYTSFS